MKYCWPIFLLILFSCKEKKQETKPVAQPPFWSDIQNFKKTGFNFFSSKECDLVYWQFFIYDVERSAGFIPGIYYNQQGLWRLYINGPDPL